MGACGCWAIWPWCVGKLVISECMSQLQVAFASNGARLKACICGHGHMFP